MREFIIIQIKLNKLLHNVMYVYIYIYIYMCVCVCVSLKAISEITKIQWISLNFMKRALKAI